jgi:hypothetical protein
MKKIIYCNECWLKDINCHSGRLKTTICKVKPNMKSKFKEVTLTPALNLKKDKKYVVILDFKTKTFTIESYWRFRLKNWFNKFLNIKL